MQTVEIPLFPLGTVLFPGGQLPLRIFEPRYLSMVGECMKQNQPFGVVLIKDGKEAGTPATFFETGTTARITDFDQLEDGMLGISCLGENRFKVKNHGVAANNLIQGEVEFLESPTDTLSGESNAHYESISSFLRSTLEKDELEEYRKSLNENWDSPEWVSFQTAEFFPLSAESRQLLLEMNVSERMLEIQYILQDNNLVPGVSSQ